MCRAPFLIFCLEVKKFTNNKNRKKEGNILCTLVTQNCSMIIDHLSLLTTNIGRIQTWVSSTFI